MKANIFVDGDRSVRIADFGLSVFVDMTLTSPTVNGRGSVRWMAPELLFPDRFGLEYSRQTKASDAYALACTCVEVRKYPCSFKATFHVGVVNRSSR
jgi:serine/threonine protein kinase